jgi:hypothetical protein
LPQHLLRGENLCILRKYNRIESGLYLFHFFLTAQVEVFLAISLQVFLFVGVVQLNVSPSLH